MNEKSHLSHYCGEGHEKTSEFMGFATADVVSLYPSIPIEDGIKAATEFYIERYSWLCGNAARNGLLKPVDPPLFEDVLRFLMTNSYISFQNSHLYHQRHGTAMGGCISVYVANAYMFQLTRKIIEKPPVWLHIFERYIDDFFIFGCFHPHHGVNVVKKLFDSVSNADICYTIDHQEPGSLVQHDQSLSASHNSKCSSIPDNQTYCPKEKSKVTEVGFRSCNFLDATLVFDYSQSGNIFSKPYYKPNVNSEFVHRTSNHPPSVFRHAPVTQLIRLKRLSSSRTIFLDAYRKVKKQMLSKGYSRSETHLALLQVERRSKYDDYSNALLTKSFQSDTGNF